jgi:transposase-like protein
MDEHNIERRRDGPQVKFERLQDGEWLREQYIEQGKSGEKIAESLGCSDAAVYKSLDEQEIETQRPVTDERLRDSDWLREQHIDLEKTGVTIAQELGCTPETVYGWLRKHDIEAQNYFRGPTGSETWNWKGGSVPYGPGWNKSKRQTVRERDDYTCQDPRCSVTQTEHLDEHGQKLHVHHLRKARDVDDPEQRNAKENLITLCLDCHSRWEKIADAGLVPEVLPK